MSDKVMMGMGVFTLIFVIAGSVAVSTGFIETPSALTCTAASSSATTPDEASPAKLDLYRASAALLTQAGATIDMTDVTAADPVTWPGMCIRSSDQTTAMGIAEDCLKGIVVWGVPAQTAVLDRFIAQHPDSRDALTTSIQNAKNYVAAERAIDALFPKTETSLAQAQARSAIATCLNYRFSWAEPFDAQSELHRCFVDHAPTHDAAAYAVYASAFSRLHGAAAANASNGQK